jgi:hypothetical protein
MASRTDALLDLVIAALGAASYTVGSVVHTKPSGLVVLDQQLDPANHDQLPVAGLYPLEEKVLSQSAAPGVEDREITVAVELRADANGSAPRKALDPVRTWVIVALKANTALRDFVRELPVEVGTVWDNHERKNDHDEIAECTVSFRLKYRTRWADPTQAN